MPIWFLTALKFVGARWIHFIVVGAVGLATWGVIYKQFFKDTNTTRTNNDYKAPVTNNNYYPHYAPFSCARNVKEKVK